MDLRRGRGRRVASGTEKCSNTEDQQLAQVANARSGCYSTHHPAPLLGRPGFPQREDVAADGDFPPQARFGVLAEAVARVHHQDAVGGQSVHLSLQHPPLGGLLLPGAQHRPVTRSAA